MLLDQFIQNCLTDTEVKVMELLHENIRRQAFFDRPWPAAKNPAKKGKKLLYQSGDMQDGYMSQVEESHQRIRITNTVPYAGIHNDGGKIPVTARMKKYFWAMYYKATGGLTKTKTGKVSASKRNAALGIEAEYWKSLALMKVGSKMNIPKRRVMGPHKEIDNAIKRIVDRNMQEAIDELMKQNLSQNL